ncbi:TolC family protein [Telmatobacter bradus]|uniref:TolC family protein n=1 Tax=Telmatobacter bradus TaxID=474953 RepID=UPI003B439746
MASCSMVYGALWSLPAVAQGPQWTLQQAIETALQKNPETQAAKADVKRAEAGRELARTWLLPQLSFTEDLSRGDDPVYAFGTRLRQRQFMQSNFALNELNRPNPIGNFSSRLSGQWMLFDSLRTERGIAASHQMAQSASSGAKAVDQKVIFQVVQAWESVLYTQRQVEVAEREQETAAALLSTAEDHVKAGLAVESDRMAALVNVAARKQERIAAEGELELAWAQLRLAVGEPELQQISLQPIEARAFETSSFDEQLAVALKTRPDLQSLRSAQQAEGSAVAAAKSAFGPQIGAYGNWEEDRGSIGTAGGNNWVAGAQIRMDIFPTGKRAELQREQAVKARVDAQVASYEQNLRLQISQARTHLRVASQSMLTAQAALDQATESLRIVKNRYDAGLTNITDLLRAEDAERESRANYWRSVYGNALSYAENLFATGTLTPEATEAMQ